MVENITRPNGKGSLQSRELWFPESSALGGVSVLPSCSLHRQPLAPILEDYRYCRSFAAESLRKVGVCRAWMGVGVLGDGDLVFDSEAGAFLGWVGHLLQGVRWARDMDLLRD